MELPVPRAASSFDLVAGTSTGGILALGLGAGKSAREIRDLYTHRGPEIFPPVWDNILGRTWKAFRNNVLNATFHRYSRQALERVLQEFLGDRIFGESCVRHVIPAFDGRFSEVFLFKTRHHRDYEHDWRSRVVDIALATSAAPTIYRPLESGGYRLIDGGVWANNPVMLAVVEAMIAYDVPRERIKVLSIGCGDEPYHVIRRMTWGGLWHGARRAGGRTFGSPWCRGVLTAAGPTAVDQPALVDGGGIRGIFSAAVLFRMVGHVLGQQDRRRPPQLRALALGEQDVAPPLDELQRNEGA
jgi:Patatin-like phospholipase